MKQTTTIRGLEELKRSLHILPRNIQKNILNSAVRAGASKIAKNAKTKVPIDKGILKKAIKIKKRKPNNINFIKFQIGISMKNYGPKVKDPFYSHMVEFGTSKMTAQPFMRPALEEEAEDVIRIVEKRLNQRLDREIKKAKNA